MKNKYYTAIILYSEARVITLNYQKINTLQCENSIFQITTNQLIKTILWYLEFIFIEFDICLYI